ncbi:MAG: SEC-C metal-binding domain-containing protein, partial [Pseudomonadota bacterium]
VEKSVLLQILDHHWREHLVQLDQLRSVIGLRGYAQRDPLNEYKSEAFQLFESLLAWLRRDVTRQLSAIRPLTAEEQAERERMMAEAEARMRAQSEQTAAASALGAADALAGMGASDAESFGFSDGPDPVGAARDAGAASRAQLGDVAIMTREADPNDPSTWGKVGRNAPCPCGSGKKYKHCHGKFL